MDNTQGDVAASVAYMLDGDGIELTPNSVIMLILDEAFQSERPVQYILFISHSVFYFPQCILFENTVWS